jgi:hypothetical protein
MIKKIKVGSIFVNEEKEITSKKDGKVYKLCEVNIKVADDSPEYAGKYTKGTFFAYNDPKDTSKNKTATEKANYFKSENEGKDLLVDITEESYTNKDGADVIALKFKLLTKAQKEVASQFVK